MSGQRVHRRLLSVAAATVAIAVGALALTGCSDDSGADEAKTREPDLTALLCPMVETGQHGGINQYRPAENAFDTAELLGMKLAEARAKAARHGCEIIVPLEDGKSRPVPIEIDPTRIYVYVEHGLVSYIEGIGGGI